MTNCHPRQKGETGENEAQRRTEEPPDQPPPAWYRRLVDALGTDNAPALRATLETADIAGWTSSTLESAAALYVRHYRDKPVTDPTALLKKIAIQEASRQQRPRDSPRPGTRKYADDYERRRPNRD